MWIKIIKWIIGWLIKHHKFLMMEAVVPEGKHIHGNPPKGRKKGEGNGQLPENTPHAE